MFRCCIIPKNSAFSGGLVKLSTCYEHWIYNNDFLLLQFNLTTIFLKKWIFISVGIKKLHNSEIIHKVTHKLNNSVLLFIQVIKLTAGACTFVLGQKWSAVHRNSWKLWLKRRKRKKAFSEIINIACIYLTVLMLQLNIKSYHWKAT